MHNQPERGPTRQDKTLERMQQERDSPGATSAGGNEAQRAPETADTDPSLSTRGGDVTASNNNASRRDDVAAGEATPPLPPPAQR
ncbi:MAG: hypothetical protein Q7T55_10165 [Solirubrobacteraceae bacterium]|nr:hypothetical protein [Solirubrobacteraceae bacterium]